jgi:hypothetical protein
MVTNTCNPRYSRGGGRMVMIQGRLLAKVKKKKTEYVAQAVEHKCQALSSIPGTVKIATENAPC